MRPSSSASDVSENLEQGLKAFFVPPCSRPRSQRPRCEHNLVSFDGTSARGLPVERSCVQIPCTEIPKGSPAGGGQGVQGVHVQWRLFTAGR